MGKEPDLQIVALERSRVAYYHFQYSQEPEGPAIQKVIEWAGKEKILDPDNSPRFFGFNNPDPPNSPKKPEYGYEFWVTIDENIGGNDTIKTKDSQSGEYLVVSGLGLDGWKWVMTKMGEWQKGSGYTYDGSRQYLEEHIPVKKNFTNFDQLPGKERWEAIILYLPVKKQ